MDTKTLAVGQEVYAFLGHRGYGYWKCTVIKTTSTGVEVRLAKPVQGESLIRFGNDGTELGVDQHKWDVAPEQSPWTLDDMPFAERTALLERWQRKLDEAKKKQS